MTLLFVPVFARFATLIDGFDGQPDRADHQREAHERGGERRARPPERKHDPEPVVEQAPDGAALSEQHQKRKAYDDGRQHEGQIDDRIDERLSRKGKACQSVRDEYRDRQTAQDAYDSDAKAERQNSNFVSAESRHRLLRRAESVSFPDRTCGR